MLCSKSTNARRQRRAMDAAATEAAPAKSAAPSIEELQEKWLERRAAAIEARASSVRTENSLNTRLESGKCVVCEQRFSYTAILIDGEVAVRRTICDACVVADRDDQETAEDRAAAAELRRLEQLERITGNAAECRAMTFDTFDATHCGGKPLEAAQQFVREVLAAGPYDG